MSQSGTGCTYSCEIPLDVKWILRWPNEISALGTTCWLTAFLSIAQCRVTSWSWREFRSPRITGPSVSAIDNSAATQSLRRYRHANLTDPYLLRNSCTFVRRSMSMIVFSRRAVRCRLDIAPRIEHRHLEYPQRCFDLQIGYMSLDMRGSLMSSFAQLRFSNCAANSYCASACSPCWRSTVWNSRLRLYDSSPTLS